MHHFFRNFFQYHHAVNPALLSLLVISGLFMFSFGMFSPIYALFVSEIGGDITVASNAWAVFSLSAGLLTFFAGRWENRIKETELGIVLSQFIISLAYLLLYFTEKIFFLYLSQIILGIGMAFFWPAFHSVYGQHVQRRKAAFQWSLYDGLAYLIPAGAAIAGGIIVNNYGFDAIFIIMSAVSFVCGLFIWILPRQLL